jgi:WD40 repeat protein
MKMPGAAAFAASIIAIAGGPCLGQEQPKHLITLTTDAQVLSVAFSPNGLMLASGGFDRAVTLWEVASGKQRARLDGHNSTIRSVAFSPDGKTVASGSWDNTIKLWDVGTGKEKATLKKHAGRVNSVDFSPDGKMASVSSDGTFRLWEVATGKEQTTPDEGLSWVLHSVAFSGNGKTIALGGLASRVILVDTTTGKQKMALILNNEALPMMAAKTWGLLCSPFGQGPIVAGSTLYPSGPMHPQVRALAYSTDGVTMAIASQFESGTWVQLWDTATGKERATLCGPEDHVLSLAFNPKCTYLAIGGPKVALWDYAQRKEVIGRIGQPLVHCVTFSSDGKLLASAGSGTIMVWRMPATKEANK